MILEETDDEGWWAMWRDGESCARRSSVWRWTKVVGEVVVMVRASPRKVFMRGWR